MADDQLRIRLLAYRIWEAEGCPDGEAERHWHMACRMVAAERITDVPQEAQPRPAPRSKKTAEPVAAAANVSETSEATDEAPAKKPAAKKPAAKRRTASAEGKTTAAKTTASKSTATRRTTAAKKGSTAKSDTTTTRKRNSSSNDDKSDQ